MKVLHENINYSTKKLHQKLVMSLEEVGIDNIVFAPTYDKTKTKIDVRNNEIISECFNKRDRYIFDLKQKKIYESLVKAVDVTNIDIVHAHTLFTDGNIALKLKKKYNIPYVVAVRNQDVYTFFKNMFFLRNRGIKILLNANAIFFLSKSYEETVLEKYIPKKYKLDIRDKSFIIPNGIDSFWFKNKREDRKQLNGNKNIKLLYVGHILENKNIETTQKAISFLNNLGFNCKLTIIGDIKNKTYYNKIINDENTCYLKSLPKEKLIKVYNNNDIFVMPSIRETFGLVYAEAMSQGLPVIYTRNQGFDKQFEEGLVGYSVNALDYDEVANRIVQIINNYAKISENCLTHFEKFDWRIISNEYRVIYETII